MCLIQFLNDNSGAIIAIATIVLAVITGFYVFLTRSISKSSHDQVNILKAQHELENRPWFFISTFDRPGANADVYYTEYENSGSVPGKIHDFFFELYYKNTLIDDNSLEVPKNTTIVPNQKGVFTRNECKHDKSSGGSVRKEYKVKIYFTYYSVNDEDLKNKYSTLQEYKVIDNEPLITIINSKAT